MDILSITVIGTPAPQGSKRFVGMSKAGRGLMIESSKAVKPWREAVKYAAFAATVDAAGRKSGINGPVSVEMIFTLHKPKSAPKSRVTYPDRKPDLSKLIRATEDALSDAGVWEDDARVVWMQCMKTYPGESNDALDVPGAVIRIAALTPEFASTGKERVDIEVSA